MRCLSCNCALTDFEATRKYASSETYIDMCLNCFSKSDMDDIPVIDRADLLNEVNEEPDDSLELDSDEDGSEYLGCGGGQCG